MALVDLKNTAMSHGNHYLGAGPGGAGPSVVQASMSCLIKTEQQKLSETSD